MKCVAHGNTVERVCLEQECVKRAMCLLCQHDHNQQFASVLSKTTESYAQFIKTLNQAIQTSFRKQDLETELAAYNKMIERFRVYFAQLRREVDDILQHQGYKIQSQINDSSCITLAQLKQARQSGNYLQLPHPIIKILLQVYKGAELSTLLSIKKKDAEGEQVKYNQLIARVRNLHEGFTEATEGRLKVECPKIDWLGSRTGEVQKGQKEVAKQNSGLRKQGYEQISRKKKIFECASNIFTDASSLISDSLYNPFQNLLLLTSYDKSLRIYTSQGNLQTKLDYDNILTKITSLAHGVYALAKSKEILIQKLTHTDAVVHCTNLMKLVGHGQRINDMSSWNSRILASSSIQGVNIWDLYKEHCECTFKQPRANPTAISFASNANLAIGLSDHSLSVTSVQTLACTRRYKLAGVPLVIARSEQKQLFYAGGFPSHIYTIDERSSEIVSTHSYSCDAVTCLRESANQAHVLLLGHRDGTLRLIDVRKGRELQSWHAHQGKSSRSKPNGVVGFYQVESGYCSVGCHDCAIKLWSNDSS